MTQILQSYFLKKKLILRIFSKTVNNIQNTNIPHDKQQKNYLNPKPKPQTNKDDSFANHLLTLRWIPRHFYALRVLEPILLPYCEAAFQNGQRYAIGA